MKLQAKDLMIGDWVLVYGKKAQIVWTGNTYKVAVRGFRVEFYEDELQPIPLTAEILEKNGFVKTVDNKFVCSCHLVVPTISKENSSVIQMNFYKDPIAGVNTLLKCWSPTPPDYEGLNEMHLCNLKSVHELQHALKLCKIEKTIEL